jgi:hypothetical protein
VSGLRGPRGWAEEYCRLTEPELFGPCEAERAELWLSYTPNQRWVALHSPHEVMQDLADGLAIEERRGDDGPYYRLSGTRYDVYAQPSTARDSGETLAYITSVKSAQGLGRTDKVRPARVSLAKRWDEMPCYLDQLVDLFRAGVDVLRRRRVLLNQAHRDLNRPGVAPRPRGELHADLREYYDPLRRLLALLEQRSKIEGELRVAGTLLGQGRLDDEPVIWVRPDGTADLAEGRTVAVDGLAPGRRINLRVAGVETDDDGTVMALAAPRFPIAKDIPVRLTQQGRFALGRHSTALQRFLNEDVEGNWEHLARLLHHPESLPLGDVPEPEAYFDTRLNSEQRQAVAGAVNSPHAFWVQGPPGTGKTTVICEVVRQLVARGERVLLLAPMHVAVDEVLGRIAGQPGVLALRISWDESKVAPELRRYLPEQATTTYLREARRPASSQATRWQVEIDRFDAQRQAVDTHLRASQRLRDIGAELSAMRAAYARWREEHAGRVAGAQREQSEAARALEYFVAALPPVTAHAADLHARLVAVPMVKRMLARIQDLVGANSELARLSAAYRETEETRQRLLRDQRGWADRHAATRAQLDRLAKRQSVGDAEHQVRVDRAEVARSAARSELDGAAAQLRVLVGQDPDRVPETALARLRDRLAGEVARRHHRIALERRWFTLSGLDTGDPDALANQVDADLRRSANLICCTTTGVNRDLGDADFDTLIVDEASRVVDSEFLIGAIRSRRWVLVGDEHQLPPYVEPADEYHLHALAALDLVDRGVEADLAAAVARRGRLWSADEETHRFRADPVLRRAEQMRDAGTWAREYRQTWRGAWRGTGQRDDNAAGALLPAMVDHLVRSLFERSVGKAPPSLRTPLILQRRMIGPIAELVRQPVYRGDFQTPDRPDVVPLLWEATQTPVAFVDTSLHGGRASERLVGNGFVNELEVRRVVAICRAWERRLRASGGDRITVSILTFYKRQAMEIRRALGDPGFRDFRVLDFKVVDAIDKIQGQQSDLVFVSFCRTFLGRGRPSDRWGRWLQDARRLNVAFTRARRALVLVGHAPTLRALHGVPAAEELYRHLFTVLEQRPDMRLVKDA